MTNAATRTHISRALIAAALILGASVTLKLSVPAYLGAEAARRLLGVLLGAVVVVFANAAPKALAPLARMRCDVAVEQSLRRFTGWSLVIGGTGYATAWGFAPLALAGPLALGVLGTAFVFVVARYGWTLGRTRG